MNWKIKHLYKTKLDYSPELFLMKNIVYNYQPLIGIRAISLYMFLFLEATNGITNVLFLPQSRILKLTNLSAEEMDLIISKLEFFNLLEIYENDEQNQIYLLKQPLDYDSLGEGFVTEFLINEIGTENDRINSTFLSNDFKKSIFNEYKRKTKSDAFLTKTSDKAEKKNSLKLNLKVDLSLLFKQLEQLGIFVDNFWNEELEQVVKQSILIYDLSFEEIALVIQELKNDNIFIDSLSFVDSVSKKKRQNYNWIDDFFKKKSLNFKKVSLLRTLSPQQYINLRLKRTITKEEEKLFMFLKNEKLSDEVINILLDFSITQNQGKLITEYVKKISSSILKLKIIKAKEVLDFLRKTQSTSENFSDIYYINDNTLEEKLLNEQISAAKHDQEVYKKEILEQVKNINSDLTLKTKEELNDINSDLTLEVQEVQEEIDNIDTDKTSILQEEIDNIDNDLTLETKEELNNIDNDLTLETKEELNNINNDLTLEAQEEIDDLYQDEYINNQSNSFTEEFLLDEQTSEYFFKEKKQLETKKEVSNSETTTIKDDEEFEYDQYLSDFTKEFFSETQSWNKENDWKPQSKKDIKIRLEQLKREFFGTNKKEEVKKHSSLKKTTNSDFSNFQTTTIEEEVIIDIQKEPKKSFS